MFPDFIVVANLEKALIPKLKRSNYKQDNESVHSQISTTYLNLRVGEGGRDEQTDHCTDGCKSELISQTLLLNSTAAQI